MCSCKWSNMHGSISQNEKALTQPIARFFIEGKLVHLGIGAKVNSSSWLS